VNANKRLPLYVVPHLTETELYMLSKIKRIRRFRRYIEVVPSKWPNPHLKLHSRRTEQLQPWRQQSRARSRWNRNYCLWTGTDWIWLRWRKNPTV